MVDSPLPFFRRCRASFGTSRYSAERCLVRCPSTPSVAPSGPPRATASAADNVGDDVEDSDDNGGDGADNRHDNIGNGGDDGVDAATNSREYRAL